MVQSHGTHTHGTHACIIRSRGGAAVGVGVLLLSKGTDITDTYLSGLLVKTEIDISTIFLAAAGMGIFPK